MLRGGGLEELREVWAAAASSSSFTGMWRRRRRPWTGIGGIQNYMNSTMPYPDFFHVQSLVVLRFNMSMTSLTLASAV